VVQRLHDGATDAKGRKLEVAIAHEWGSELEWTLFVPTKQGQTVSSENFVTSFTRYLAYTNQPNPDFQLSDLKFTLESFWKTVQSSSYLAALDPDLSAFSASGGKLLLWHGWNDQHISPQGTLAYYDALRKTVGAKKADSFAKLYMFPGVAHCGGGDGPNTFDVLTPVMAWAESATKPAKIVASNVVDGAVTRTRPVYPYPQVARYDGTGSVDDASNFVAATPSTHPAPDAYDWVGKRLYSSDYQTSCRVVDGKLVCRPTRTWLTARGSAA
jgi:feruloyl esterase